MSRLGESRLQEKGQPAKVFHVLSHSFAARDGPLRQNFHSESSSQRVAAGRRPDLFEDVSTRRSAERGSLTRSARGVALRDAPRACVHRRLF